jgi:hypothetical protein
MAWQKPKLHSSINDGTETMALHRTVFQWLPTVLPALATMAVLALGPSAPCHAWSFWSASPEEEAYEKSRDEFKAVQDSVSTTKGSVENTKQALDVVVSQVDSEITRLKKARKPIPANLKNAAARLKNAQKTLERSQEILANFGEYSEKITAATDVYDEIVELRKKMEADRQSMGNLAAELRGLGKMMEKGGEYVPILGDAVKAYGTITTGLVDKLGEVATTIDQNRNQDQLGHGTYDTNEKNRLFREFQRNHSKELIADVYHRSVPPYLYEPVGGVREGNSVLWDEDSRQFTIVPKDVPATDIFKMTLLINKRLSASDLVVHMGEWKKGGAKRLDTARAMQTFLTRLRRGPASSVMSRVSSEDDDELFILLRNPRLFEARYVYDRQTHDQLHHNLQAIYDGLMAEGSVESKAQAEQIARFAKKYKLGIVFTKPAPVEQKKPERKTVKKEEPSFLDSLFDSSATQSKKAKKVTPPANRKTAAPQQQPPQKEAIKTVKENPAPKPAAAKPAMKAGQVGSCSDCAKSGLDCACGKAACRCCAPGDSNCNAFDL